MELFSKDQIEVLFSEPFSDAALDYAEAIYSSMKMYQDLLRYVPVGYFLAKFHLFYQLQLLNVMRQYSMLRAIVLRDELEVYGVYRRLIEQGSTWNSLMNVVRWLNDD